jgi:SAM-dependent methyltransferase
MLIKRLHPDVDVVGLDPDPKALARAQRKTQRAAIDIHFDQGFADALPYPEASFDRVFSSFMFHHLQEDEKGKTLREVRRVLKPGGSLHLLDFGGSESGAGGFFAGWFHSSHGLRDNSEERILTLMRQAGFADPETVGHGAMLFGHMAYSYYHASVSAPPLHP